MAIPTEQAFAAKGLQYKLHSIPYEGLATTFDVDQSATNVALIEPITGGPTVTLGTADAATFVKTVSVAAGGSAFDDGCVNILISYGKSFSSVKS